MKFSTITAAGAVFGLAAATPIVPKRAHIQKRQVPQEQSHGIVLSITNEFMKLDNTKNIVDAVFGLLGNAAAEEGAGDVTNLDCLKQETADQAFTNAKAAGDIRGMAGALLFQSIERNTGGVGVKSVLCTDPAVNAEIGALTSHQDAAAEDALAQNKAITLELARQLAAIGADPNLALLSGTFAPGDVNDNTGAGNTCDTEDLELGCIFTEKLLVLDATEDEIASAVEGVEQTFTGTGGIFATDLVTLADFEVAVVADEFDLSAIVPGTGAAATPAAGANETAVATPGATTTPAATETATATVGAECSLVTVTVGADQTAAVKSQYPSAVVAAAEETQAADNANENNNADQNQNQNQDQGNANQGNAGNTNECNANQGNAGNADQGNADQGNADQNQDDAGNNAGAAAGNIQTFTGALGGAPPAVSNTGSGDRPFEVNGATFNNERAALVRSCDIQNNQCFNAVNGGELAGGTEQCATQLQACQAAAGGANARRARGKRSLVLGGGSNNALLGAGASKQLIGGNNIIVAPSNNLVGGVGQGLNLGQQLQLLQGGNLAALLGGGIVGAVGGVGAVIPPSVGNQQLVSIVLQQCK